MTSSDKILGEKLFDGKHSSIYRNGVAGDGLQILWDDVEKIYVSGSVHSINGIIPSGEFRSIRIIDSNNTEINFELSAFFRMKQEYRDQFGDAYAFVLNKISTKQWTKFLQTIVSGGHYPFGNFNIAQDGFYFSKVVSTWKGAKEGFDIIETPYIKNCSISQGSFYIQYQVPKKKFKLRTERIGEVKDIPNIHIIQYYISYINIDKTKA